jgi:hypothetical protein
MAIPVLSDLDLHRNQLVSARLENRASSFSSPLDGMLYFDSQGGSRRIRYVIEQTATPDDAKYQYIPRQDLTETVSGLWTFSRTTNAPFAVLSGSAKVNYLDSDMLDGNHSSVVNDANTVALRDANGRLQFSDPSADLDGVNYLFMRNYVAGILSRRAACRVVATTALAATRSSNTLTANANGSLNTAGIDGITNLAVADRILVVAQTAGQDNGIYIISSLGDAGNPWVMQRAADFDTSAEVVNGSDTVITDGTNYKGSEWLLMTADPITLNTTVLVWFQIGASTSAIAGNGLVRVGNTYHVAQSAPYTTNSLPYANSTSSLGFVSNNASANRTFLMQVSSGAPIWDSLYVGDIPTLGITKMSMNTGRLLGRTTASTGAVEEITPSATNFTFTGLALNTIQNINTGATPQFTRLGLGTAASGSAPLCLCRVGSFEIDPVSSSQLVFQRSTDNAAGTVLEVCSIFAATRLGGGQINIRGPATSDWNKRLSLAHDGTNASIFWGINGYLMFNTFVGSTIDVCKMDYNKVTFYQPVNLDNLTASQWVKTDASKNLVSVANLAIGDMQMNTGRLLGRTTAATGAIEEITPGTSLTFSALALNTIQGIRTTDTPQFARLGLGVAAGGSDPLTIGTVFSISSTGDITKLKNLAYVWPSSHVHGQLHNDGSGNLTWAALGIGDMQMSTARLLGRTTAATGAVEEITPGTSLTFSALALNTIQGIRTTDTPQFARLGLGVAAHATDPLTIGTAFKVDASNNTGCGTMTPIYRLVVSNAGAEGLEFGPGYSSGKCLIQSYNRSGAAYAELDLIGSIITFVIGASEKARIDASGNVSIVGLTASKLVATDGSKNLVSVTDTYPRKVVVVKAGSDYNDGSDYIDVTHNLGTHDVQVEVRRTKDETGATDATQQRLLCDIHAGSYANNADTNKIHLHFGNDPNDNEEFTVVITG